MAKIALLEDINNAFLKTHPEFSFQGKKFYQDISDSVRGYIKFVSHRGWAIDALLVLEIKGLPYIKTPQPFVLENNPKKTQEIIYDLVDYFPLEKVLFYGKEAGTASVFSESKNNLDRWFNEVVKLAGMFFPKAKDNESLIKFLFSRKVYKGYKRFGFWNYFHQPYILYFLLRKEGRNEEARLLLQEIIEKGKLGSDVTEIMESVVF